MSLSFEINKLNEEISSLVSLLMRAMKIQLNGKVAWTWSNLPLGESRMMSSKKSRVRMTRLWSLSKIKLRKTRKLPLIWPKTKQPSATRSNRRSATSRKRWEKAFLALKAKSTPCSIYFKKLRGRETTSMTNEYLRDILNVSNLKINQASFYRSQSFRWQPYFKVQKKKEDWYLWKVILRKIEFYSLNTKNIKIDRILKFFFDNPANYPLHCVKFQSI